MQGFFKIPDSFKFWVLKSASKKWKDFKSALKRKHFKSKKTIQENISNGCNKRIPDAQWEWLVKHWKSSKSKVSKMDKVTGLWLVHVAINDEHICCNVGTK